MIRVRLSKYDPMGRRRPCREPNDYASDRGEGGDGDIVKKRLLGPI